MRKILLPVLAIFFGMSATAFASGDVRVEFNAMEVEFDQPAVISENRTLVPVRKIFELLGAEVSWDDGTRTAISEKDGKKVTISIGSRQMYVNGEPKELDVPAKIINNRTLVPLRAISEAYTCDVSWDGNERVAEITSPEFAKAEKTGYVSENGLNFEYFSDTPLSSGGENTVSAKSGACSITISAEKSADITIDDSYIAYLVKGLGQFNTLSIKYVRKASDKNAALIGCYNKGNSIYYLYANKGGMSYNLAVTVPDGAQRYDAEKLMYIIKSFSEKM